MKQFVVEEMLGNFSKVVFTSEDIEECREYVLALCDAYTWERMFADEELDYDVEFENQLSYFSIRDLSLVPEKRSKI